MVCAVQKLDEEKEHASKDDARAIVYKARFARRRKEEFRWQRPAEKIKPYVKGEHEGTENGNRIGRQQSQSANILRAIPRLLRKDSASNFPESIERGKGRRRGDLAMERGHRGEKGKALAKGRECDSVWLHRWQSAPRNRPCAKEASQD